MTTFEYQMSQELAIDIQWVQERMVDSVYLLRLVYDPQQDDTGLYVGNITDTEGKMVATSVLSRSTDVTVVAEKLVNSIFTQISVMEEFESSV